MTVRFTRTHRRRLVLAAVLLAAVLGLTGVLSLGAAVFWGLIALTFLWTPRQTGTYTVDRHTPPSAVALHAGASDGSAGAANHVSSGNS